MFVCSCTRNFALKNYNGIEIISKVGQFQCSKNLFMRTCTYNEHLKCKDYSWWIPCDKRPIFPPQISGARKVAGKLSNEGSIKIIPQLK